MPLNQNEEYPIINPKEICDKVDNDLLLRMSSLKRFCIELTKIPTKEQKLLNQFTIYIQKWFDDVEPSMRTNGSQRKYPADWRERREYIRFRDSDSCQICGLVANALPVYWIGYVHRSDYSTLPFNRVHHIVPISKGGDHRLSNLVLLCDNCHADQHMHMLKSEYNSADEKYKRARRIDRKEEWKDKKNSIVKRMTILSNHQAALPDGCFVLNRRGFRVRP